MKSSFRFAILIAMAVLPATAAEKPQSGHPLPDPPFVSACQPGMPGGTLALAIPGNPRTFNSFVDADGASDAVIRLIFSPLVSIDMDTQDPRPALAESWSVAPDQKTWTLKLRRNLRWSDGEPLTADDVVFTWNDIMYNPQYNRQTYDIFRTGGKNFKVTKVDDVTIRVVTPEVFAPFLEYFGNTVILPKHILARWVYGDQFLNAYSLTNQPMAIVGSGPFRLKEFQPNRLVRLERNPEFWAVDKQGRRLPYFDEVRLDIASTPEMFRSLFIDGTSAAYENIRPEDFAQLQLAAIKIEARFIDLGAGVQRDFLWFNQNTGVRLDGKPFVDPVKLKWFSDKRFRQAVSCAVNRDKIIQQVYAGRARAAYGFLSSYNKKWDNPSVPRYSYDPQKARALLAEMGLTNHTRDGMLADAEGHPVAFTLVSSMENPARRQIALLLNDDLKELGIRLDYKPVNFTTLQRQINGTMDYEAASLGLGGGGLDPASQMNVLKSDALLHQWFPSQHHPSTDWEAKLDSLMDAQIRTLDIAERKKYFDQVQAIWAEELPMICLAAPSTAAAIRSDIGNVRPAVAAGYHVTWNIDELYFKK